MEKGEMSDSVMQYDESSSKLSSGKREKVSEERKKGKED